MANLPHDSFGQGAPLSTPTIKHRKPKKQQQQKTQQAQPGKEKLNPSKEILPPRNSSYQFGSEPDITATPNSWQGYTASSFPQLPTGSQIPEWLPPQGKLL